MKLDLNKMVLEKIAVLLMVLSMSMVTRRTSGRGKLRKTFSKTKKGMKRTIVIGNLARQSRVRNLVDGTDYVDYNSFYPASSTRHNVAVITKSSDAALCSKRRLSIPSAPYIMEVSSDLSRDARITAAVIADDEENAYSFP